MAIINIRLTIGPIRLFLSLYLRAPCLAYGKKFSDRTLLIITLECVLNLSSVSYSQDNFSFSMPFTVLKHTAYIYVIQSHLFL